MLGKRELRIKLSKTPKNSDDPTTTEELFSPETIALLEDAGKRFVKHIALAVVAVVAVIKVLDTAEQVTVKKTKSADKK